MILGKTCFQSNIRFNFSHYLKILILCPGNAKICGGVTEGQTGENLEKTRSKL